MHYGERVFEITITRTRTSSQTSAVYESLQKSRREDMCSLAQGNTKFEPRTENGRRKTKFNPLSVSTGNIAKVESKETINGILEEI
jgi:hypothetical protein